MSVCVCCPSCCIGAATSTLTSSASLAWTGEWSFEPQPGQFPQRPADSGVAFRSYSSPILGTVAGGNRFCSAAFQAQPPTGSYSSEWDFFPFGTQEKLWMPADARAAIVRIRTGSVVCQVEAAIENDFLFDFQANGDTYQNIGFGMPYVLGQTTYSQTYYVFGNDRGQMVPSDTNTMPPTFSGFLWDGVLWRITAEVSL